MIDINHIEPRHDELNLRLERWAKWVRINPAGWPTHSMFKMYQSKARQWEVDPHIPVQINTLEACETERAVSCLPEPHRTAIRWYYVFPGLHTSAVGRKLAVTHNGLAALLHTARDMLKNRLREKLTEKEKSQPE